MFAKLADETACHGLDFRRQEARARKAARDSSERDAGRCKGLRPQPTRWRGRFASGYCLRRSARSPRMPPGHQRSNRAGRRPPLRDTGANSQRGTFMAKTATERDQSHTRRRLPGVVPAGDQGRRPGRELARARLHGDQALGLGDLGEHAASARRHVQGHRPRERLLPALHPAELPGEGSGARRGLRQGMRGGHAPPAGSRAGRRTRPRRASWKSR